MIKEYLFDLGSIDDEYVKQFDQQVQTMSERGRDRNKTRTEFKALAFSPILAC